MYNMYIWLDIRVLRVEHLTFDILLHAKSEQKVIGYVSCTPITFKNPLKSGF